MEDLERNKMLLKAIREAIANICLEKDFDNITLNDIFIKDIYVKIKKLGGINE